MHDAPWLQGQKGRLPRNEVKGARICCRVSSGTLRRLVDQQMGERSRKRFLRVPRGYDRKGLLRFGGGTPLPKTIPWQLVNLGKWGLRTALQ
jgi:hypothetical protein